MRAPTTPTRGVALMTCAALCLTPLWACEEAAGAGDAASLGDGGGQATRVDWDATRRTDLADDTAAAPAPATLAFLVPAGDDGLPCLDPAARCAVHLAHGEQREIAVAWTLPEGPVGDQVVKFGVVDDDEELGFISALSAYTATDGVAAVSVGTSRADSGQFSVKATVEDPAVPARYFDVVVTPDGVVPLTVATSWASEAHTLATVTASLHAAEAGCGDLAELATTAPLWSSTPTPADQHARILDAGAGGTFTLLVVGHDADAIARAWTCVEGLHVDAGTSTGILLALTARPPAWSGELDVTIGLEAAAALSAPPYDAAIAQLLTALQDPALLLLGTTCGTPGLEGLCKALFQQDGTGTPTPAGEALAGVISADATSLSKGTAWGALLAGALDLQSALGPVELNGTLSVADEPQADGSWPYGTVTLTLTSATARWQPGGPCDPKIEQGCDAAAHLFALENPAMAAPELELHGADLVAFDLTPLTLSIGELLQLTLRRAVLPHLVPESAAPMSSWLDLLVAIAGGAPGCLDSTTAGACCASWIDALVEAPAGGAGQVATLLAAQCHALLKTAAQSLASVMPDAGSETVELALHPDCEAVDGDGDHAVDTIGSAEAPCGGGLSLQVGNLSTTLDTTFHAVRAP